MIQMFQFQSKMFMMIMCNYIKNKKKNIFICELIFSESIATKLTLNHCQRLILVKS